MKNETDISEAIVSSVLITISKFQFNVENIAWKSEDKGLFKCVKSNHVPSTVTWAVQGNEQNITLTLDVTSLYHRIPTHMWISSLLYFSSKKTHFTWNIDTGSHRFKEKKSSWKYLHNLCKSSNHSPKPQLHRLHYCATLKYFLNYTVLLSHSKADFWSSVRYNTGLGPSHRMTGDGTRREYRWKEEQRENIRDPLSRMEANLVKKATE